MLFYTFETILGWVGIAGEEGKISALELPRPDRNSVICALKEGINRQLVESLHDFSGEAERISAYFGGERVNFQCEIDAPYASAFDWQVWNAAKEIPYGELATYGELAAGIGRPGAARAVGSALGRNLVPIIVPCHRVIRGDGGMGGFSSGLWWKETLHKLEKSRFGVE